MRFVIVVCLLAVFGYVQGQDFYYEVSSEERIYEPFFDGTKLNNGIWSDPSYSFDTDFPVNMRGTLYDNIQITTEGTGGSLRFNNQSGDFTYMALAIVDLMDRGRANPPKSLSPIRHKTTGPVGDRVLTLQYHNCGFAVPISENLDNSDYLEFQLMIYERTGNIEVAYGERSLPNYPSIISDTQGNTIAFFKNFDSNYFQDSMFYLVNNPDVPEISFIRNGQSAPNLWQTEPQENTVIRFTPRNSGTRNVIDFDAHFKMHQTADALFIESLEIGRQFDVSIYNMNGLELRQQLSENERISIALEDIPFGIYVVTITTEKGMSSTQIIR